MSIFGAEFLKNIKELQVNDIVPDVQFHQNGYLFLANTEEGKAILRANNAVQQKCGANWIKLYSSHELRKRFPWLNINDTDLGSCSDQNEGYFDPWTLVNTMKQKSISQVINLRLISRL
jgi:FAD-dependent oxidoreductase domain-containing protein 1